MGEIRKQILNTFFEIAEVKVIWMASLGGKSIFLAISHCGGEEAIVCDVTVHLEVQLAWPVSVPQKEEMMTRGLCGRDQSGEGKPVLSMRSIAQGRMAESQCQETRSPDC